MSKIDLSFLVPSLVLIPTEPNPSLRIELPTTVEEVGSLSEEHLRYSNDFVTGWTIQAQPGKITRVKVPGTDAYIAGRFAFLHTLLQHEKMVSFEAMPLKLIRVFYENDVTWELVSSTTLEVLRRAENFIECVSENFVEINELMINDVILYNGTKIIITSNNKSESTEWDSYLISGKVESTLKPITLPRFYVYPNRPRSLRLYRYSKPENNLLNFIPYLQIFKATRYRCQFPQDNNHEDSAAATLADLRAANSAIIQLPYVPAGTYYNYSCAFLLKGAQPLWSALNEEALKAYFQKHKTLSFGHQFAKVINYGTNAEGLKELVFDVVIGRSRKKEHFRLQNNETELLYTQLYKKPPAEYLTYAEIIQFIQDISENYALLLTGSAELIDNFDKVGLKYLLD